jgi:hypothetical protein
VSELARWGSWVSELGNDEVWVSGTIWNDEVWVSGTRNDEVWVSGTIWNDEVWVSGTMGVWNDDEVWVSGTTKFGCLFVDFIILCQTRFAGFTLRRWWCYDGKERN